VIELDKNNTLKLPDAQAIKDIVSSLVKPKLIVEVGTWKGHSASIIAAIIKPNGVLYCVDHWEGDKVSGFDKVAEKEDIFSAFRQNMKELGLWDVIHVMYMSSLDAARVFKDDCLDMVFIDANHSYKSVLEDIIAWYPKLKIGGILCGHDYFDVDRPGHGHVGVTTAIKETIGRDVELQTAEITATHREKEMTKTAQTCVWKHIKKVKCLL